MLNQSQSSCAECEPFALQVLGDDMAPEFPAGCIVIGEPNAVVSDGSYVIAHTNDEYIFRQLKIDQATQDWWLVALKPGLPKIKIPGPDAIRAKVVQSTEGRRSSRKFYS